MLRRMKKKSEHHKISIISIMTDISCILTCFTKRIFQIDLLNLVSPCDGRKWMDASEWINSTDKSIIINSSIVWIRVWSEKYFMPMHALYIYQFYLAASVFFSTSARGCSMHAGESHACYTKYRTPERVFEIQQAHTFDKSYIIRAWTRTKVSYASDGGDVVLCSAHAHCAYMSIIYVVLLFYWLEK